MTDRRRRLASAAARVPAACSAAPVSDDETFVAGPIYRGVRITFDLELETVTEIFIGAAAE